jgi:diaminopimelate epimerase
MQINFSKYHGAGNDFIMIDGRSLERPLHEDEVAFLCHRYFGIGADGVIVVEPDAKRDFKMRYYNADGSSGAMCANGSRCAIKFADRIGYAFERADFSCCDIPYLGKIYTPDLIGTSFPDQTSCTAHESGYHINNGAPHFVMFVDRLTSVDPRELGRKWRYHPDFMPIGVNVNFIEQLDENQLEIITYERGVEDITLACGTGALASAMAFLQKEDQYGQHELSLESDGGTLIVKLNRSKSGFSQIEVLGPAMEVFSSSIAAQKLSMS